MYYTIYASPIGEILIAGDGTSISYLNWTSFIRTPAVQSSWIRDVAPFNAAIQQLDGYFSGERPAFDIPIQQHGTAFQSLVWQEIAKIPYGHTTTYAAIARSIGKPQAVRAVGTAVGSNPHTILVPCHRVLTSAGGIGGYAGGLAAKYHLLKLENIPVA